MKINDAAQLFRNRLSNTNKKDEIKVYERLIAVLEDLEQHHLSSMQIQTIEEKLTSLNLDSDSDKNGKFFNLQFNLFTDYLRTDLSLITEGYYTGIGIVFGILFGTGLGLTLETIVGGGLGISLGLSIGSGLGIAFGIIFGSAKDAEAKKEGRVLKIELN